ncbi:MAG: flagellar motor protein MotB [Calditrichaeota bacterium]|nr:flagellar motor protein MotB [Calditrichota bacterium]MBT7790836.1 flagellar motor protein MotB [Calditrichota bacterium]
MSKSGLNTSEQFMKGDEDSESEWLISYGDMMTLLLAFFVLLLALSDINPVKMQLVSNSMNEALGGVHVKPLVTLAEIQKDLEKIVSEENLETQAEVNRDLHGVTLSLKGSSFFTSGSTELLEDAIPFLSKIAGQIKQVPYQIAIEGHTDNVPMSSNRFASNWELSAARASTVVRFFTNRDVPPSRLRAIGYADTRPVDSHIGNQTAEARAQNRRVVILFLDEIK